MLLNCEHCRTSREIVLDTNNNLAPTCLECEKVVNISNSFMVRQMHNLRQMRAITQSPAIVDDLKENNDVFILSESEPNTSIMPSEISKKQQEINVKEQKIRQNAEKRQVINLLNK